MAAMFNNFHSCPEKKNNTNSLHRKVAPINFSLLEHGGRHAKLDKIIFIQI